MPKYYEKDPSMQWVNQTLKALKTQEKIEARIKTLKEENHLMRLERFWSLFKESVRISGMEVNPDGTVSTDQFISKHYKELYTAYNEIILHEKD